MKKKECKIIQDLLPNYIEKLTNKETNQYIEEHLNSCEECKSILENMKYEIELTDKKRDNREVKYIRKFSNKMKFLKVIILIIILYILISIGRNMYLITSLSNKANKYCDSTNLHTITTSYDKDFYTAREVFQNGDKIKVVYTFLRNGELIKQQIFQDKVDNEYWIKIYSDYKNGKRVDSSIKGPLASFGPYNIIYIKNFGHLLKNSIQTTITSTVFDGNECYYFSNYDFDDDTFPKGVYIDKETGLLINSISYQYEYDDGVLTYSPLTTCKYEFGTVEDKDFIEPDINEYEQENFVR